jgi:urease accessory protein
MASRAGVAGCTVLGTMVATLAVPGDELVGACRAVSPAEGQGAVTRLPGLFVARYLGNASEAARDYFAALWQLVRPVTAGRAALTPRIWRT